MRIPIRTGGGSYEVLVGRDLLGEAGTLVRALGFRGRGAVISDETVAPLFAAPVLESLRRAGFGAELITVAAGETAKSIARVGELCERLSSLGLDRRSFVVSLGGGVIGDLAGFVAAIYLRGIPYVSVPTTLLAQVDSCIGGKTGVNSAAGKNLIGSFHPPALVLADSDTLQTLPERIWNEGFAEAIKHGIIRDPELFADCATVEREDAAEFVRRNIAIKAAIVAADEREQDDVRALLNFGHTVGHAIEHAAGYGNMLHGEALSLGMVAAARISARRAGLSSGEVERIVAALAARELPTTLPPDFPREKILPALKHDKKFVDGEIRFVVAHAIGQASVSREVTMEDLREAVEALSSRAER